MHLRSAERHRAANLGLALCLTMAACAPERTLESVEWQGRAFKEVRGLADLPVGIQSQLGASRTGLEGIADRGRPFNVTDVVDKSLPMRRLLTAARDGDAWLVAVEVGGMAYRVDVFLFSAAQSSHAQHWVLLGSPKTLRDVVRELSRSEMSKRRPEGTDR